MAWRLAAVGLLGCGRIGIDPVVHDATGKADAPVVDATADAPGSIAGVYTLDQMIDYTCAAGLVTIGVTTFTFAVGGTSLTVTSNDAGAPQQPCTMPGTVTYPMFDVTCTLAGSCNETYELSGMMTGAKSWSGTFTATYTGTCLNCTMQSDPRTGTKP